MSARLSTTAFAVIAMLFSACGPESNGVGETQQSGEVSQAACNPDYQQCSGGNSCEDLGTCEREGFVSFALRNSTPSQATIRIEGGGTTATQPCSFFRYLDAWQTHYELGEIGAPVGVLVPVRATAKVAGLPQVERTVFVRVSSMQVMCEVNVYTRPDLLPDVAIYCFDV